MSSVPHPPASSGVTQAERFPRALDPASAPLDGRSPAELTEFARAFASKLAFWNANNEHAPEINWPSFLPQFVEGQVATAEKSAARSPQQALFLTFLKLFEHAQGELNNLTDRHLEFYYRKILRLTPRIAIPDCAHLTLDLKKSASEVRIPAETIFKSTDGLCYRALEESFAHQSELVHQRLLHRNPADDSLSYAAIAHSGDGFGSDLPEEDPSWHPFGHGRDLEPAPIGFALSSHVLLLAEGNRSITITLEVRPEDDVSNDDLRTLLLSFQAELSGEEEWLPAALQASVAHSGTPGQRTLTLTLDLGPDDPPVTAYDPTVLEGGFDTIAPTVRFRVSGDVHPSTAARLAEARLVEARIKVSVSDIKSAILENDFGRLDSSKPFAPFGPLPKKGSSFYLKAAEALEKNVTHAQIELTWKDPPENFKEHYAEYLDSDGEVIVTGPGYFTADLQMLSQGAWVDLATGQKLFTKTSKDGKEVYAPAVLDSSAASLSQTRLSLQKYLKQTSKTVRVASLKLPFSDIAVSKPVSSLTRARAHAFRDQPVIPKKPLNNTLAPSTSSGFLRVRLQQGFFHQEYPLLFAQAFASQHDEDTGNDKTVPNAPYTPEVESFRFSYTATSGPLKPAKESIDDFENRPLRFFHLTPFGQREEHAHIKASLDQPEPVTLLPARPHEGELYLGLSGLAPKSSVSLLIQVLDGSSNPLTSRRTIEWSVLASNHWRKIEGQQILADTTNGFLSSGVVRLLLPGETTDHNTLLEPGLVWLRAHVDLESDGVCRLLAIMPNALTVELTDPTAATHLDSALPPGSITTSQKPLAGIKEIKQPYASFGGAAAEDKTTFRRRTSERLRHRNRAITPWDYERLVLEHFPELYRIQCLSHTNETLHFAPGHVTLVTIPDTRNTAASNSLAPLTEQAVISRVNDFLRTKNSPFATAHAVSASFEPVTLTFHVAFRTGHPFTSYRPILNEDIRRHLSPWAYDDSLLPDFGGTIYRSTLIAFIESLEYVDYLTEFELRQAAPSKPNEPRQVATPSRPGAILTSATEHVIHDVHS